MSSKEKKDVAAQKIIIGKGRVAECGDPTLVEVTLNFLIVEHITKRSYNNNKISSMYKCCINDFTMILNVS